MQERVWKGRGSGCESQITYTQDRDLYYAYSYVYARSNTAAGFAKGLS